MYKVQVKKNVWLNLGSDPAQFRTKVIKIFRLVNTITIHITHVNLPLESIYVLLKTASIEYLV